MDTSPPEQAVIGVPVPLSGDKRCPGVGSAIDPTAHPNGMGASPEPTDIGVPEYPLYDDSIPLEDRDADHAFANSCDLRAMNELISESGKIPFIDMCLAANSLIPEYTAIFAKNKSSRRDYNPAGEPWTFYCRAIINKVYNHVLPPPCRCFF